MDRFFIVEIGSYEIGISRLTDDKLAPYQELRYCVGSKNY